jgi:hypothetical protein
MNVLIIKLNATGDVVRTTPLLRCLKGEITWVTVRNNLVLLGQLAENLWCVSWEERDTARDSDYDLVINLEDMWAWRIRQEVTLQAAVWGALNGDALGYTEDSRGWFDLSVISIYGKAKADILKFQKGELTKN